MLVKCPIPHEVNRHGHLYPREACVFCAGTGEVQQVKATCQKCNGKTFAILGMGPVATPVGTEIALVVSNRSHCCDSPVTNLVPPGSRCHDVSGTDR